MSNLPQPNPFDDSAAKFEAGFAQYQKMVNAIKDAIECLNRLPNVEGAYRVTCIEQLKKAIE